MFLDRDNSSDSRIWGLVAEDTYLREGYFSLAPQSCRYT